MRIKITPTTAASKRPASPSGDSDDSSATQSTKKRRVRRPALSNDEDMAILRAVITLQPYRALWGQGRLKWQEAADRVAQQTGGEMSDELCKGRYVNLLKRYTTPQEDRKRPWPKDEQLKLLLEEALVLQTKWEEEVKDEVDEKPTHRRKWQPLQGLGKLPSAAETATSTTSSSSSDGRTQLSRAAAGDGVAVGDSAPSAPLELNAASAANAGASPQREGPPLTTAAGTGTTASRSGGGPPQAAARPTRWTAPAPGARAPTLFSSTPPPVLPPPTGTSANPQAAALASRAVASATRAPGPVVSSGATNPSQTRGVASRPPVAVSEASVPASSIPSSTPTATGPPYESSSTSVATTVSTSTIRTSTTRTSVAAAAPAPSPVPARALPTPAPWSGSGRGDNVKIQGLNQRAPTSTPASTPPRETKPQVTTSTPPDLRVNPHHGNSATPPTTAASSTIAARGNAVRTGSVQETVTDQHARPTGPANVANSATNNRDNKQPASTPSAPSSASTSVSVSSSSSSSTTTTSRAAMAMPPHRGFPVPTSTSQYSHVRLNGSSFAPQGPSQARYIPLANAPFPMPDPTHSTRASTPTILRERESSPRFHVNNRTQPPRPQAPSGAHVESVNTAPRPRTPDRSIDVPRVTTPPHAQRPTSIESTLFAVLDRLTAMETARLEDTREEREFKRRQLEIDAMQWQHGSNNSNNRNNSSSSNSASPSRGHQTQPRELEELSRTTATLTTSLATSRQQHVDLQMEVGRLVPALQAVQREHGHLQQEILSLTTHLKGAQRERDELKQDLSAVVKTMKQMQLAMQRQEDAFEDYKKTDAIHRKRELDAQQATLTRQLEQFQDALQVDRRKREELLLSIQKEREYNQAQHRERLRELDVRANALVSSTEATPTGPASTQLRSSRVEAELAELRIAIDVERSEREREYTTLLQNIKQIIAGDESA